MSETEMCVARIAPMHRFSLSPRVSMPTLNDHNSGWLRPQKLRFRFHNLLCEIFQKHEKKSAPSAGAVSLREASALGQAEPSHALPRVMLTSTLNPTSLTTTSHTTLHQPSPYPHPMPYPPHLPPSPHLPKFTCKRAVLPRPVITKTWSGYRTPHANNP